MPARLVAQTLVVAAALLLAICAGALWSLIAMIVRSEASFMALPAAFAAVIGAGGMTGAVPWRRAVAAAFLTVLAAAVALYLRAALLVAGSMGLAFDDALASIGPEMAGALAYARLSVPECVAIMACVLLAAGFAWRQARTPVAD